MIEYIKLFWEGAPEELSVILYEVDRKWAAGSPLH